MFIKYHPPLLVKIDPPTTFLFYFHKIDNAEITHQSRLWGKKTQSFEFTDCQMMINVSVVFICQRRIYGLLACSSCSRQMVRNMPEF